jgi:hypothetical protein
LIVASTAKWRPSSSLRISSLSVMAIDSSVRAVRQDQWQCL